MSEKFISSAKCYKNFKNYFLDKGTKRLASSVIRFTNRVSSFCKRSIFEFAKLWLQIRFTPTFYFFNLS